MIAATLYRRPSHLSMQVSEDSPDANELAHKTEDVSELFSDFVPS